VVVFKFFLSYLTYFPKALFAALRLFKPNFPAFVTLKGVGMPNSLNHVIGQNFLFIIRSSAVLNSSGIKFFMKSWMSLLSISDQSNVERNF